MISKKDSKPFLIKFPIGVSKTNKLDMIYQDEWEIAYGLISNPTGALKVNEYGNTLNFDKVITTNANSITRRIAYNTLFMIDDMPSGNYSKGDYYVKYIFPEYNNEIVIGLDKLESIKMPKIYFYHNENLLYFQLNYDNEVLKAYANINFVPPISIGDYVWDREPRNIEQEQHRLILSSIEKIGFDERYKPFIELTFEEYEPEEPPTEETEPDIEEGNNGEGENINL